MSDLAAGGLTAPKEKVPWTPERVEMLRKLWGDGHSASQIAGKLGQGVTRNAVIGKVHRLNLAGRVTQTRPAAPRAPRESGRTQRPHAPSMPQTAGTSALKPILRAEAHPRLLNLAEPKPLRLVDLPKDGRITILHLSDKTCRWPSGDPGTEEFCFCGHTPRENSPYCEYHSRIAYQPAQERRMRRA
jgi:GcrA cell cycle regulator